MPDILCEVFMHARSVLHAHQPLAILSIAKYLQIINNFIQEIIMFIPKLSRCMVQTYLMDIHYNTTAYGLDPRSFLPYHGLKNKFTASKTDKNYFIFGSGKRACPGRHQVERLKKDILWTFG
ncbi:hypothetical protein Glove_718g23 [Diversispora epigaea]|uniref:Cytochrome P450 n=1 Tax=Diversispora epigaea TaxID=1348612 RepID=A0A397G4T5_9GLOM|nr:hypothetical protein Glove_718g23 [Diversispora epigaea]